jgi:hypothetical protein
MASLIDGVLEDKYHASRKAEEVIADRSVLADAAARFVVG